MRSRRLLATNSRSPESKTSQHPKPRRGVTRFFSFGRERMSPGTAQLLFDLLRRPAERDQFIPRVTRQGIESQRTKIGANCLVYPSLDLQGMTKLQVRVGRVGVQVDRFSIGRFRLRHISGFLQRMTILDPHLGRVWHVGERTPVIPYGEFPSARFLGAFGSQDLWTDRVASAARVKPWGPVALIATDTGEDRAGGFVGEKEALPVGLERLRANPGWVEPGVGPALPQRLVKGIVREDLLVRRRG